MFDDNEFYNPQNLISSNEDENDIHDTEIEKKMIVVVVMVWIVVVLVVLLMVVVVVRLYIDQTFCYFLFHPLNL